MDRKLQVSLQEIFTTFKSIGIIGFCGGLAVVSCVERYSLLAKKQLFFDEFMDGLALGELLGPFSLINSLKSAITCVMSVAASSGPRLVLPPPRFA